MGLSNSVKHNSSLSENWAGVSKDPQETIVFLTKSPKVKLSDFPPDFPRLQSLGRPGFFAMVTSSIYHVAESLQVNFLGREPGCPR